MKLKVSEVLVESKYTDLIDATYNDSTILFKFSNSKTRTTFYRTVDKKGNFSDKEERDEDKREFGIDINSFGRAGFVDIRNFKDNKGYSYKIQFIDNKGVPSWEYEPEHEKGIDEAAFLASNDDYMCIFHAYTKSLTSNYRDYFAVVLNRKGEEMLKAELKNDDYKLLPHKAYFEKKTNNVIIIGEYYDEGSKASKSKSLGIFVKKMTVDGKEISENFISWEKDVAKKVSPSQKKEITNYSIYFHNIIMSDDGKILAIGEQYRKQVLLEWRLRHWLLLPVLAQTPVSLKSK